MSQFEPVDEPTPRFGCCGGSIGEDLLVFGGIATDRGHCNELLRLSKAGWAAWRAGSGATAPAARASAAAVTLPNAQLLVVFGGMSTSRRWADTWVFSTLTLRWRELTSFHQGSRPPPPRNGHSATLVNEHHLLIIGGFGGASNKRLDDAWLLNLASVVADDRASPSAGRRAARRSAQPAPATLRWRNVSGNGPARMARSEHSAVLVPHAGARQRRPAVVVFGGNVANCLDALSNELALLDPESWQWSGVDTFGDSPPPRRSHSACVPPDGERMLVYGGFGFNSRLDDLWELNLTNMTWTELLWKNAGGGGLRGAHVAALCPASGRLLVWGGFGDAGAVADLRQLSIGRAVDGSDDRTMDGAAVRRRNRRPNVRHPYGADSALSSADPAARAKRKGLACWQCGRQFRAWNKRHGCASCHHQFCAACATASVDRVSGRCPLCLGRLPDEALDESAGTPLRAMGALPGATGPHKDARTTGAASFVNFRDFSVAQVGAWLAQAGLERYQRVFEEGAVDGSILGDLDTDLVLQESVGMADRSHRCSFLFALQVLRDHQRSFESFESAAASPLEVWPLAAVLQWLSSIGLAKSREIFTRNAIHGGYLAHLTEGDLRAMLPNKLHRMKIMKLAARLPRLGQRTLFFGTGLTGPAAGGDSHSRQYDVLPVSDDGSQYLGDYAELREDELADGGRDAAVRDADNMSVVSVATMATDATAFTELMRAMPVDDGVSAVGGRPGKRGKRGGRGTAARAAQRKKQQPPKEHDGLPTDDSAAKLPSDSEPSVYAAALFGNGSSDNESVGSARSSRSTRSRKKGGGKKKK